MQVPIQWLPVSIVKGGRPANLLVNSMESEWGKKLFAKTLIRSIAQPVWKVCSACWSNTCRHNDLLVDNKANAGKLILHTCISLIGVLR